MKPSASAAEAAAIAAALQRFAAETAAPPVGGGQRVSPWTRAALLEGVSAKATIQDLEGGTR